MNKKNFFLKFGLNHNKLNNLFIKFGITLKNKAFVNTSLEENLNKYLNLQLEKKEIILKKNYLIYMKQLENGSYKGYKRIRGLPAHNQRTKTNAKTNRNKK